ncbi:MAG TPA: hypothetical protein VMJ65_24475 [Solirubrobacteraceae bacterium]|nr:hypothetical protein [Solirubrobacteraceae bacterium]
MNTSNLETIETRPKRADAQRNYAKLLEAARAAFTEADTKASLEDIARRAGAASARSTAISRRGGS